MRANKKNYDKLIYILKILLQQNETILRSELNDQSEGPNSQGRRLIYEVLRRRFNDILAGSRSYLTIETKQKQMGI